MLNRLFQAAVITFLLSVLVGANSVKATRTTALFEDGSVKLAAKLNKHLNHAFVWNQHRVD